MKREPGMAYNISTLNKVFAFLSVLFLLAIIWMVFDDYIRPWKAIQVKAMEIEKQVLQEKIKLEDGSINQEELKEIKDRIAKSKQEIGAKDEEIAKLNEQLNGVDKKIYVQNMYNGVNGSKASALQFKYEHALVAKHWEEAKEYKKEFEEFKKKEMDGKDNLKALKAQERDINNKIKEITKAQTEAEKELKKLVGSRERLVAAVAKTEKNPIWALRNAPFIDYLDPTIKIEQYVIENDVTDLYFQQVPKIDRCTTCHTFISKPGFENQPNPYKTHPKINELAVGVNSPHPIKKFGCTSCHGGVGDRVNDFNSPVHVPQNEEQKQEWMAKYHWHEPHKIPQPMLPLQYTEGMCLKCHKNVERVPMAAKLNKGRELIEQYGCYGCHKIEGWQHLEKPGPSLQKIVAKTNKNWAKNWIWNPHAFNEKSKMPAFFMQANNSKPEFKAKNETEVNAIAEYLWETSKSYKPIKKFVGGNAENGKELIQKVGCVACHMVEGLDEPYSKVGARKGTYLTGTGSKVDPDWLVSWLKKPSHYQEDTIMPNMRLSDKEANDIASYLLSLKNEEFENLEFIELNKELRDEILVSDYFSAFDSIATAKKRLAKMTDHERTLELGRRSINKFGCYSCHNINGFEGELPKIGPELTKIGSKPIHQFGFGQQKQVEHTRHAWISQHLKLPSIWDIGVPKPFKDLNRMPNFYLSDKEIEYMVTNLLGQVDDPVPLKGQKLLNASEKIAEEGRRVVNKYNCQGCHKIDGLGGLVGVVYEDDPNYGPPWLVKEGHRVKTDWFNNFLRNVHTIRPYVEIRMPSFNFSNEEVNKIIAYFQADANQVTFEDEAEVEWEPGERAAAKRIFDELACTSCHTLGFNREDPLAPNLHNANNRLRASWIEKWIKNPYGILPYTSMPSFWENGEFAAVEGVLDDDPMKQIRAVRKYVQELGAKKSGYPDPLPYQD